MNFPIPEESTTIISDLTSERDSALVDLQIALEERDAARKKERAAELQKQAAILEKEAAIGELEAFKLREKSITSKLNSLLMERDAAVSKYKAMNMKLRAVNLEKEAAISEKEAAVLSRDKAISTRDNAILRKFEETSLCLDWKLRNSEDRFPEGSREQPLKDDTFLPRKDAHSQSPMIKEVENSQEVHLEGDRRVLNDSQTSMEVKGRVGGNQRRIDPMDSLVIKSNGANMEDKRIREIKTHNGGEGQASDDRDGRNDASECALFKEGEHDAREYANRKDNRNPLEDLVLSNYGDHINEIAMDSNLPRTLRPNALNFPLLNMNDSKSITNNFTPETFHFNERLNLDESVQIVQASPFKDRRGSMESNGCWEESKKRRIELGSRIGGDREMEMAVAREETRINPLFLVNDGEKHSFSLENEESAKAKQHSPFVNKTQYEQDFLRKGSMVKNEVVECSSEETEDERSPVPGREEDNEEGKTGENEQECIDRRRESRKQILSEYSWDLGNEENEKGNYNTVNVSNLELGGSSFPSSSMSNFPSMRFPARNVRGAALNYEKMSMSMLEVEEIIGDAPLPYCSCTDEPHTVYKIGEWGFQSSCCTAHISLYPLPYNDKGRRLSGRRMSRSAFAKVLLRVAKNGGDASQPVDLRDFWGKHGRSVF